MEPLDLGGLKARVELDMGNVNVDLARARDELMKTKQQLHDLEEAARDSGAATRETYELIDVLRARTVELRQSVAQLSVTTASQTAEMHQLAAATTQVSTAMVQAGGSIASTMMGMQRFSRSLLYMTSGEPMTMLHQLPRAFGGLAQAAGFSTVAVAGLTTGVGLAAAAGVLLYHHYGDLEEIFIGGYTKTEAERMEMLENATHRTAAETKELHKWKKAIADLEKLNQMSSDVDKTRAKGVEHTIGEVGPGKAQRAVAQGLFDSAKEEMAELSNKLADIRAKAAANGGAMTEAEQGKYNELETKRVILKNKHALGPGAFNADATDLLLQAAKPEGRAEFDRIRKMMAARPQTFGGGLNSGFQAASPEQQKLDQEGKEQGIRLAEKAHADKAARSDLVDSLNKEGQEYERDARDENPEIFERGGHKRRREEAEAKRQKTKDDAAHKKQIHDISSTYRPAYSRTIASAMDSDRQRHKDPDASDATIAKNLRKQLVNDKADIPEAMLDEVAAKLVEDMRKKFAAAVIQAGNEGSGKPLDALIGTQMVEAVGKGKGKGKQRVRVAVADDLSKDPDDAPDPDRPGFKKLTKTERLEQRKAAIAARKANVLAAAKAKHARANKPADADDEDDAAPDPKPRFAPGEIQKMNPLVAAQHIKDEIRRREAMKAIEAFEAKEEGRINANIDDINAGFNARGRIGANGLPLPAGPGPAAMDPRAGMGINGSAPADPAKGAKDDPNVKKTADNTAEDGPVVKAIQALGGKLNGVGRWKN